MEDSLEDYIKLYKNTNKGSKTPNNVRPEALVTAQKKKETEARAVKIVEFLIEGKLRPQVFLRCLKHINQAYYQDVVEERAITGLCGYSLCGKTIQTMPKQRYFINTKSNKVYDVTDRKNYCSNYCYTASLHVKEQVDDSPLWLRSGNENKIINLYPLTEKGSPGEEIDQGLIKREEAAAFTSVSSFTAISLEEIGEMEDKKLKKTKKDSDLITMATLHETDEDVPEPEQNVELNKSEPRHELKGEPMHELKSEPMHELKSEPRHELKSEPMHELKSVAAEPKQTQSSPEKAKKKSKKANTQEILKSLKNYINEWVSLETCIFVYGEEAVKQFFDEENLTKYLENLKISEATIEQQRKYLEICKKLQLTELAEQKLDRSIVGGKFKPLPDYKQIKEESKTMDLKVRSFYSALPYESKQKKSNVQTADNNDNGTVENSKVSLPLTDAHSQVALRRKVFLNSVCKSLTNLLPNLGFGMHCIVEDLNALVKTFNLQPHNVVLSPAVRTIISIILLKMLCQRDSSLNDKMSSKRADIFIKAILGHFSEGKELLDEIFTNIESRNLIKTTTLVKLEKQH